MLKKAGIVVVGVTASLLAVSPIAFAGEKASTESTTGIDRSGEGLVNLSGNDVNVPVNVCDNQVPVNVLGVQVPLNDTDVQISDLLGAGALGLLGDADAKAKDSGDTIQDDSCKAGVEGDTVAVD